MTLVEKLNIDIKSAMIEKDNDKKDELRAIKSAASLLAKEKHVEVSDEFILDAAKKEMKQLNQTIASLKGKENTDLYKSTAYRIKIVETYLPKQMTEDEIREAIVKIIKTVDKDANFGVKMKAVMSELKGKADGKLIQNILKNM